VLRRLRRVGIALGSLVAAWLAFGPFVGQFAFGGLVVIVLGALIYLEIIRRDHGPRAASDRG
jgi:hypothetical protein